MDDEYDRIKAIQFIGEKIERAQDRNKGKAPVFRRVGSE